MLHRFSYAFVLLIVVLLALPIGALYFLAYTPAGLAMIIGRLPERIGPVTLRFEGVSGTIAHGMHIDRFELDHERVHIALEDASTRVSIAPLFWQLIEVPEFDARKLRIEVRPRTKPPKDTKPRFLPPLLRIRANDARLAHLQIVAPGGNLVEFFDSSASGAVGAYSIRVFDAQTTLQGMRLQANGTLRAEDPLQLDASVRGEWQAPEGTAWTASASARGNLDRLEFTGQVAAPFRANVKGTAETLTRGWVIRGDADVSQFRLADFNGGTALDDISGQVAVVVNSNGIRASGRVESQGLRTGPMNIEFDGKYAARTLAIRKARVTHAGSTASVTTSGFIRLQEGGPSLDLSGGWNRFRWPLNEAEAPVSSQQGRYTLRGVMPYSITARGDVTVVGQPPINVDVAGVLSAQSFEASRLRIEALGGSGELRGRVAWKPRETWQLAGRLSQIDIARAGSPIPGRLSLNLDARGEGFTDRGLVDIRFNNLSGHIRGEPASGRGRIQRNGPRWLFEGFEVRAGNTFAMLEGSLAPNSVALRFDVKGGDLEILAEGAKGQFAARGTMSGNRREPVVDAVVSGSGLEWNNMTLGNIGGNIRFDASPGSPIDVNLHVVDLGVGGRLIEDISLIARGLAGEHTVLLKAKASPVGIDLKGVGGFTAGEWHLAMNSLEVLNSGENTLVLAQPSNLVLGPERVKLDRTCLRGNDATLCAEGFNEPTGWSAKIEADDLPISTFTAGVTRNVQYEGRIDAKASAGAATGEPWRGEMRVEVEGAQVRRRLASGREEITAIGTALLTASATPEGLVADASIEGGEQGSMVAHAEASRAGEGWREWPLKGYLKGHADSLGFIAVLVDAVDRSGGKLTADLTFTGSLGLPTFSGAIAVREGSLDFYQVNLPMRELSFDANFFDNALQMDGSAKVGDGVAGLGGRLEWRGGLPYGRFGLKGEHLRLVNVPEARIYASPDLLFDINGRNIHVTGEVVVPEATLEPAQITNAVFASADEVIVGEELADPSKQFVVTTDVRMVLGDKVLVDTFGLTGRLTGSVQAQTKPGDVARGTGELSIEDGRYLAFGRRLDIERGRLIFNSGPLSDPGIDIRASREFPDVTAGVNIRGTLRTPRLTLWSDPQLAQTQILSLLVAGGSLESVQNQGSRGGSALAMQGGAILAQQLGSRIGLEDISLESTLTNETSLVLGRFLTPRLYVSYGVSLTQAINTLKMRYFINDRWTIRLESGEAQSIDLEYVIERR